MDVEMPCNENRRIPCKALVFVELKKSSQLQIIPSCSNMLDAIVQY
jgi:hypothetical protein